MVTALEWLVLELQRRARAAVCSLGRAEVMVTVCVTSFSVAWGASETNFTLKFHKKPRTKMAASSPRPLG